MKYHEKLNLKSPIYKYNNTTTSRTPTKSPIKPAINPSDLFQKVCCPNCKYAFKIIRQQIMKENPVQSATPTGKKSKLKERRQIQTQTEGILTLSNNNSPTKSMKSQPKYSKTYDFSMNQNFNQKQFSQLNQIMQPQNRQNRYLHQSDFKFKPLSLSPHNKLSKSRNLLKTLDVKQFKIQASDSGTASKSLRNNNLQYANPNYDNYYDGVVQNEQNFYNNNKNDIQNSNKRERSQSGYNISNIEIEPSGYSRNGKDRQNGLEQSGLVSPHASSGKLQQNHVKFVVPELVEISQSPNKFSRKISSPAQISMRKRGISESQHIIEPSRSHIQSNSNQQQAAYPSEPCCKCKDSKQFQELITQIVLKNEQNQSIVRELQQFCKIAGEEIQVPSFCKMLAFSE